MYDVTKLLSIIAAQPGVRRFVGTLRDKGVGDYLALMGLYPSARMMILPGVGIFAAGAVCGATAAVLLTPRTGEALRADIVEMLDRARARVEEKKGERRDRNGEAHASA